MITGGLTPIRGNKSSRQRDNAAGSVTAAIHPRKAEASCNLARI